MRQNNPVQLTPEQIELKHQIIRLTNSAVPDLHLPQGSPAAKQLQEKRDQVSIAIAICLQNDLVVKKPEMLKQGFIDFIPEEHVDEGYYFAIRGRLKEHGAAAVEIVEVDHKGRVRSIGAVDVSDKKGFQFLERVAMPGG